MKKILAALLAALMLFTLAACGGNGDETTEPSADASTSAPAADEGTTEEKNDEIIKTITTGTGGTGGTYFGFTNVVAGFLNTDAYKFDVVSTGGSRANIEMIADGDAQFAIVQNDVMNYAYEGTNGFDAPIQDFSTVACLYAETCQLVTTAKSGIKTVDDLKGKTVAVGAAGSGVYYNAVQILEAAGIDIEKDLYDAVAADFNESSAQLADGSIDAAFVTAGAPTAAITELATKTDVVLVDLGKDVIDSLTAKYSFYEEFEATADNTYPFVEGTVSTVAIKATFIVDNDMSEDQVYEITKNLWEKQAEIGDETNGGHPKGKEMVKENAVAATGKVPVHPGAEKYYKEIGVIK